MTDTESNDTADLARTNSEACSESADSSMHRMRLQTQHRRPTVVYNALRPDNTASISMATDADSLCTEIERETTGGLHATVDDTVVNLTVADAIVDMIDKL
jgi:uncharacterized protein YgbK (DUF1537 family)